MAPIIRKRKRQSANATVKVRGVVSAAPIVEEDQSGSEQALQRILQRHFEARFEPLPKSSETEIKFPAHQGKDDSDASEESDWDGFEEEGKTSNDAVQIVEVRAPDRALAFTKAEAKAFMNSKPPSSNPIVPPNGKAIPDDVEDSKAEKLNLKNDLELHRLINESHLLDPSKTPSANHRQKLLDMRMQAIGSKKSMLKQEKMPISHRKGIVAKAKTKEVRRRQDAKENGVILEKEVREVKQAKKRTRGVTGPSVGKFAGGMLKLSKRDVASITGPRKARRR